MQLIVVPITPPPLKQLFGVHLRAYRRSLGLSQEAMAERLDESVQHLSRLERGENVTLDKIDRLAVSLGVDARDFLTSALTREGQCATGEKLTRPGVVELLPIGVVEAEQVALPANQLNQPAGARARAPAAAVI